MDTSGVEERTYRAAGAGWLAERHPEWNGLRSIAAVAPPVTRVRIPAGALGGERWIGEEQRRIVVQASLITFQREHIVCALVHDTVSDLLLRPYLID